MRKTKSLKRNLLNVLLIGLFLFSLVGCVNKNVEEVKPYAKGFIWEAVKGDEVITLVGTMHPAPNTHNLMTEEMIKVVDNCDTIYLEADLSNQNSIQKLQSSLMLKDGETYDKYLNKNEISKINEIIEFYNQKVDQNSMKKLNSFGLGNFLSSLSTVKAGMTTDSLEKELTSYAKEKSKEIAEIEGIDYQINLLKDVYTWDYVKMLINDFTEEDSNKTVEVAKQLFDNYVTGDLEKAEGLEKQEDMKTKYPREYNLLIYDRNINMAEKIDNLVGNGKKDVVAVGYRHFLGEDSLLNMLEDKGFTIKRIN